MTGRTLATHVGRVLSLRLRTLTTVLLAFTLLTLLCPAIADAHALLLRSDPAADTILRSSPAQVHLWFSEDLNGSASQIIVWDRYRHVMNLGHATLVPGQPRQMVVKLKPLPAGSYLVLWTSVSAEDGHLLRGSYLFSVKKQGPGPSLAGVSLGAPQQTFPDTAMLTSLIAHWLELLSAVVWGGIALFSLLIFVPTSADLETAIRQRQRSLVRRWLLASLVLLLLASAIVLLMEAYDLADNDWSRVLSHSNLIGLFTDQYAQLWIVREGLVLLAVAATLVPSFVWRGSGGVTMMVAPGIRRGLSAGRAPERDHTAYIDSNNPHPGVGEPDRVHAANSWTADTGDWAGAAVAALGVVYLYLLAASGHAASAAIGDVGGSHIISLSVFADWLHLLADALWFGGQFYIVLVLIPAIRDGRNAAYTTTRFLTMLNRFSPAAYASIALFIVSGAFAAKVHIPSWYAFFNSVYGKTLIVKMALIGGMMLTSALTVYVLRPRLRETLARAASDPIVAALPLLQRLTRWLHVNPVLGAGVLLATSIMFYYPVPAGFSPAGPSAYVTHAAGLTATMTIKPDRSGPNQITVELRDQQGRPVQQARLVVLTTMLDMPMGTGLADLNETKPGTFTGTTDLGMGGHWRLQILMYQPSGLSRMSVVIRVGT